MNIENLDRLIVVIDAAPDEKFSMVGWYSRNGSVLAGTYGVGKLHQCGTAACIAGYIVEEQGRYNGPEGAAEWLGISNDISHKLFMPPGYNSYPGGYSRRRALRTLRHMRAEYLRTGQVVVDWDAPEQPERKPWAAPHAAEVAKPLPAELTGLLQSGEVVP